MRNNKDAIKKVFDDLDNYRDFCRQFGWVFDEKDLYKPSTPWGQFSKWKQGERVANNWSRDRGVDLRQQQSS